jgi:subtilisin family serine protease
MVPRRRRLVRLAFLALMVAAIASPAADSIRAAASEAQQANRVDVLILFASQPGPADHDEVRRNGGQIKYAYRIVPAIAATLPEPAVAALQRSPRVVAVEPDVEITAFDQELDNSWGVKRIGAGALHDAGTKGSGVTVAVLDTGIDYTHDELWPNYLSVGYDFENDDADPMDDNGHGTHVAGTIAAADNGDAASVVGVAPEAKLIALKVLDEFGSGSFSNVVAALDWLVQYKAMYGGRYVTNHSYGSSLDPGITVFKAFAKAYAAGILHVAAAGNNGNCSGKGGGIGFPALYESVIAVTAVDNTDTRACFSSVGSDAELAAPGVEVLSTFLGDSYALGTGTSMASPHVAGVAALVMAGLISDVNQNGRTNDDVRTALAATANDLGTAGRDPLYGYGLVDPVEAYALEDPPTPPATIAVQSIAYRINNNKGTKTLVVTIKVVDGTGAPVRLADVTARIWRNGATLVKEDTDFSATTGEVIFWVTNPPSGTYTTTVTLVDYPGLAWDLLTPPNQYVKN